MRSDEGEDAVMSQAAIGRTGPAPERGSRALRLAAIAAAAVGHLVVLVPFTVGSGLVAPLWAVVVLHVLWGVGAVALVRLVRRRPLAAPLVPMVNLALLWLIITVGELALGWTA